MNIVLVFLLSGSLNFGSFKLKLELGAEILGLLGLSTIYQKNSFFALFLSQNYEKFYAKIKDEYQIYVFINSALNFEILGKDVHFDSFNFDNFFDRRATVFVVSDFLNEINLDQIAFKKRVYAVILRDKFEENLSNFDNYNFIDATNFRIFEANLTKSAIKKYKEILKVRDEKLANHFLENRISFGKIYTDEDPYLGLLEIVRS